ncbi:MAG TPA: hypothetical protein VES01_09900 [Dermatophilaceae bacterium]|nr:hypothetical protein [Dermatophilaceae bacterium]
MGQSEPGGTPDPCWRLSVTDEELLALHDDPRGVVMLPYAATLPPERLAAAVETARRGLVLRGLLSPQALRAHLPPEQANGGDGWDGTFGIAGITGMAGMVCDLFMVRDNAEAVLAVQRTTPAGPPLLRYLHLVEDTVLVEDVTAEGVHLFGVLDRADLPGLLQAFLVPPDAVDGTAPVRLGQATGNAEADPRPGPDIGALAQAAVTADVVLRQIGDGADADHPPDLTGFFLGAAGCHRVVARVGAPSPLIAYPVPAARVGDLVAALLEPGGEPGVHPADGRLKA